MSSSDVKAGKSILDRIIKPKDKEKRKTLEIYSTTVKKTKLNDGSTSVKYLFKLTFN